MATRETAGASEDGARTPWADERPEPLLSLRLLGAFALNRDGRGATLGPTAARLVAYVALGERPVPRRVAARELWPNLAPQRAMPMLRSTLWRLNRGGCPLVRAAGPALRLPDDAWIDAREVAHRAMRLVGPTGARCADGDLELLAGAGELLPGWYDDWAVFARERFRHLRLHALEALSGALVADGRCDEAVAAARAAVDGESLREGASRRLVEAHAAAGRTDLALGEYEDFRARLGHAIGATPSPLMEDLIRAVSKR